MDGINQLLLGTTAVFVLGIGAQWLAWRVKLPSILLLLIFGFIAGPVAGWVKPDEIVGPLIFPLVSLAVSLILFEGGLTLKISELRESGKAILNLVSLGALVTWILAAGLAYLLLGTSGQVALVLGALLTVTGPTVIGPLLRHVQPTPRLAAIVKWEGIVIDPIGAVLAVLVYEAVKAIESTGSLTAASGHAAFNLFKTLVIGIGIGGGMAAVVVVLLRRKWVPDFLQSPVLLMLVLAGFTASDVLQHESGLLTVTVMGIVLGNQKFTPLRHIVEFKENLRTLLISVLFILLAARITLNDIAMLNWRVVVFVAVLMLVVRPAAVLISTLGLPFNWREKLFLAWMAPRGIVAAAVASVFAFRFGEEGRIMVSATFLVIVGTVAIYGLTAGPLARWLKLANPDPQGVLIGGAHALARAIGEALKGAGYAVLMLDKNRENLRQARMQGLATYYGSILSEQSQEEIDLTGIGRMLALTPNNEVNSLAALHFGESMGRDHVYQLPISPSEAKKSEHTPEHLHGAYLFSRDAYFDRLDAAWAAGARIKKTAITKEFPFEKFREQHGENALILFVIRAGGPLHIMTDGQTVTPAVGDSVISLVNKEENTRPAETSA